MNNTGNMPRQVNSKNNKQFMNTSFDASKSANNINYVGSAYMSTISTHGSGNPAPSGSKLSKVGLKHTNGNSR